MTAGDGNMYFVPNIPDGFAQKGWFIRQDWLDKLGLQAPKTVDELRGVLTAFKTRDPNGNGQADEVPYFNREATASYETAVNDLFVFWNATKHFKANDGKVVFGPLEPAFKDGVRTLAQWYEEGLIDSEIYTRGGDAREMMLGNDVGGVTHDWFASTSDYNGKLASSIEGFAFVPFAPPAGVDGVIREATRRRGSAGAPLPAHPERQRGALRPGHGPRGQGPRGKRPMMTFAQLDRRLRVLLEDLDGDFWPALLEELDPPRSYPKSEAVHDLCFRDAKALAGYVPDLRAIMRRTPARGLSGEDLAALGSIRGLLNFSARLPVLILSHPDYLGNANLIDVYNGYRQTLREVDEYLALAAAGEG
jgi:hypothetical protein